MGTTVTLKHLQGHSIGFDTQLDDDVPDPAVIQIDQPKRWAFATNNIYHEGLSVEIPAEIMDQLALAWLRHREQELDDAELVKLVKKREGQAGV